MKLSRTTINPSRELNVAEIDAVNGGDRFGYWVGVVCYYACAPIPALVADIVTGGGASDAAGQVVSSVEDWVNGKK